MSRGKTEWNCWTLFPVFDSWDYTGWINNDKKYNNKNTRKNNKCNTRLNRIWKVKVNTNSRLKVKTKTE